MMQKEEKKTIGLWRELALIAESKQRCKHMGAKMMMVASHHTRLFRSPRLIAALVQVSQPLFRTNAQ